VAFLVLEGTATAADVKDWLPVVARYLRTVLGFNPVSSASWIIDTRLWEACVLCIGFFLT
jgi:hypothetical protein